MVEFEKHRDTLVIDKDYPFIIDNGLETSTYTFVKYKGITEEGKIKIIRNGREQLEIDDFFFHKNINDALDYIDLIKYRKYNNYFKHKYNLSENDKGILLNRLKRKFPSEFSEDELSVKYSKDFFNLKKGDIVSIYVREEKKFVEAYILGSEIYFGFKMYHFIEGSKEDNDKELLYCLPFDIKKIIKKKRTLSNKIK